MDSGEPCQRIEAHDGLRGFYLDKAAGSVLQVGYDALAGRAVGDAPLAVLPEGAVRVHRAGVGPQALLPVRVLPVLEQHAADLKKRRREKT